VEIVHPATLARFENFRPEAQIGFLSLVLSGWMYRFALVGMSVLIAATSVVVLRTGVLPRWVAFGGFVAALFALLRFLIAWGGLHWGWCGWWRSRCFCLRALAPFHARSPAVGAQPVTSGRATAQEHHPLSLGWNRCSSGSLRLLVDSRKPVRTPSGLAFRAVIGYDSGTEMMVAL
jgi:hypothetical protein